MCIGGTCSHTRRIYMSTRLLFMAVLSMLGGSAVADIFLLGDYTPIYSLTPLEPHHGARSTVEGNQELFLRFANSDQSSRVVIRFGERTSEHAVAELYDFYSFEIIEQDRKISGRQEPSRFERFKSQPFAA